jgi:cobalt/nickel transport system permease protein
MLLSPLPLVAVHIADNVLAWPWLAGGWLGTALLLLVGSWRMREEEIPRVALLTAAFFVASSIHVPLGPASAHLLLGGLLGVVLGVRAAVAIPIGVAMQAALLGHGGFSTIGINSCIMAVPALLAAPLFTALRRLPGIGNPWVRAALIGLSAVPLVLGLVNCAVMLGTKFTSENGKPDAALANEVTLYPATIAVNLVVAMLAAIWERRLHNTPEFPLGLLVGELSVLATVGLNCLVLIVGGESDWQAWALLNLLIHLPIAVIEGIVLGFTIGFLAKVKPELLGYKSVGEEAA